MMVGALEIVETTVFRGATISSGWDHIKCGKATETQTGALLISHDVSETFTKSFKTVYLLKLSVKSDVEVKVSLLRD